MPRTPEREAFLKDQALGFSHDTFDQFHKIFHALEAQNPGLSHDDLTVEAVKKFYPILAGKFVAANEEQKFKMIVNLVATIFVGLGKMHKENDSE